MKVKIEFFVVVPNRGECHLPDVFNWIKKICFLAKVISKFILNVHVVTVRMRTLIAISRKWPFLEFQNLSSPTFFEVNARNLQVMVLGLKQNL